MQEPYSRSRAQHYQEAERLLMEAELAGEDWAKAHHLRRAAQVHATLATVATEVAQEVEDLP